jgi:putative SOS response-associated peptidase YedK
MCGRFTLATPRETLAALFGVDSTDWNDPRFNIAPQVRIVTVRREKEKRIAQSLLWGAVNPRDGRPLINARSETVATSPLFGPAFVAARVLVPADGFFEWTKDGSLKVAHYFQQPGGRPFAFAGIAVAPAAASTAAGPTAVILTTKAAESVREVHDRMPLIVDPNDFDTWLDPAADPRVALQVIAHGAHTQWSSHTVGPAVNNVRNDRPENIRKAAPPQSRLF